MSKVCKWTAIVLCCLELVVSAGCKLKSKMTESEAEQEAFRLINQYRESIGLNTLDWSDVIARQCRIHSQNMATGAVDFSHAGFDQRIAAIDESLPFSSAAENLAKIADFDNPAEAAFDAWLKSQPHKENIEDHFDVTGIGVAKDESGTYYFTQIFVLRK